MPTLLYGSENWYLTEALLDRLECFQVDFGRRILKFPVSHSSRAVRVALQWPSVAFRVLQRKLTFLRRLRDGHGYVHQELLSWLLRESASTQLIKNCHFLEDSVGVCGLTKEVLNGSISAQEVKAIIEEEDPHNLLAVVSEDPSTQIATSFAARVSWLKLWVAALDWGVNGTKWMQALVKVMTGQCSGQPLAHYAL